jgi:hypothetical protein
MITTVCAECRGVFFDVRTLRRGDHRDRFSLSCAKCNARIGSDAWQALIHDDWAQWNDERLKYLQQRQRPIQVIDPHAPAEDSPPQGTEVECCWFCSDQTSEYAKPGRLALTKFIISDTHLFKPSQDATEVGLRLARCRKCAKQQRRGFMLGGVGALIFGLPGFLLLSGLVGKGLFEGYEQISNGWFAAGFGGIVLIFIGIWVGRSLEVLAHRGIPRLEDHPIVTEATAAHWKAGPP